MQKMELTECQANMLRRALNKYKFTLHPDNSTYETDIKEIEWLLIRLEEILTIEKIKNFDKIK